MGNGASLGLHETNEQGIIQNQKQIVARKGRKTVLVNIVDIAEARNRDPEHLTKGFMKTSSEEVGSKPSGKLIEQKLRRNQEMDHKHKDQEMEQKKREDQDVEQKKRKDREMEQKKREDQKMEQKKRGVEQKKRKDQKMEQKERKSQKMEQKKRKDQEMEQKKREDRGVEQKRKKQEMEEKCVAVAAQDKLPVNISFQGATGLINGIYKRQKSRNVLHPDKVFRQCKRTSNSCYSLSYDSSGRWVVMQGSNVLAYCGSTGLPSPCDVKRWYVKNSERRGTLAFLEQPTVTVTNLDTDTKQPTKQLKIPTRPERRSRYPSRRKKQLSRYMREVARMANLDTDTKQPTKQLKIPTRPERRSRYPSRHKKQLSRYMREVARMARIQGRQRQVTVLPSLSDQSHK